jgi:hypothetical protein
MIGAGGSTIKDSGIALSSVGGVSISFQVITKNFTDATTATVYNHTLGVKPKWIQTNFISGTVLRSGYCDISSYTNNNLFNNNNTWSIVCTTGGGSQIGSITDATTTTYTISWTKDTTPTGTTYVLIILYG